MLTKINRLSTLAYKTKITRCFSQNSKALEKTTKQVIASNQLGRIALDSYINSINIWLPTLADPKFKVILLFLHFCNEIF